MVADRQQQAGGVLREVSKRVLACVPVSLAFVALVYGYWWLLSQGTWNLIGFGWRGDAYDSLAASLLNGRANIDPDKIQVEAFHVNGQIFMYFGAFPALLRIPFVMANSPWVGHLSPLSCFTACLVSIVSYGMFCLCQARRYPVLAGALLLGFGAGTPLAFLAVSTSIYHEAILWGLAGAVCALVSLMMIWQRPKHPYAWLFLCSIGAGVAFLSRITFGIPAYVACVLGLVVIVVHSRFSLWKTACACVPASAAILFQMWYNNIRFGSPFSPALIGSQFYYINPNDMGGWFNPARIFEAIRIYFAPGLQFFFSEFPYVRMVKPEFSRPEIFFYWKEPVAPLSITATWLVVLAVVGLVTTLRARAWYTLATFGVLLATWGPILSFYNVTGRFTAEFIPVLLFIAACGFLPNRSWVCSLRWRAALIGLIAWSIASTVSSAIAWPIMVRGVPLVSERLDHIFSGHIKIW